MALIEKDAEELLQRRLEESIRSNVEARLFRHYRNAFSIIVTTLGLVGVSLGWPAIQGLIERRVASEVQTQVARSVADAEKAITRAKEITEATNRAMEVGLELIRSKQDQINDTLGRLDVRSDDLTSNFARINGHIEALNQHAETLRVQIDSFNEQFKFDLATQEDLKPINQALSALAAQSGELAAAVRRLEPQAMSANGDSEAAIEPAYAMFESIATQAQARSDAVTTPKRTVYIQFAGGRREDIKLVSDQLRQQGWLVPGEERLAAADGLREVRYFHDQDRDAAQGLAADTNLALQTIGFGVVVVSARDFTTFPKPPRPGVLELWVGIPAR